MKKLLTILLFACVVVIFTLPSRFMEPLVLIANGSQVGWFPMINLNHNSYLMWRSDHISLLAEWLFPSIHSPSKPVTPLIILFAGTLLIVRMLSRERPSSAVVLWMSSILPTLILLDTVGLDPVVLGALAWVPLLATISCYLIGKSPRPSAWILLGLLSLENCLSANHVALVSASCAIALAAALTRKNSTYTHSSYNWGALLALIVFPALITTATAPEPPLPDYPKGAHVIPENDTTGAIQPLIGPAYPIDSFQREDARKLYKPIALYLGALAAIAFMLARTSTRGSVVTLATTGLALSILAILDTYPPDTLALISPLASVARLIPWASTYAFISVCIGAMAWLVGVVLVSIHPRVIAWPVAMVSLFTLSLSSPELFDPFLQQYAATNDRMLKRVLSSPSAAVVRHFAYHHPNLVTDLNVMRALSRLPGVEASDLNGVVTISPDLSSDPKGRPAEKYWRWSPRRGKQLGDELVTIQFPQPITIRGLELDPGTYTTDFPRGLSISGGPCDPAAARQIFAAPSWQGSLAFTPKGYPYLTPRNQVRAFFKNAETVTCLYVRQTAQAPFDWSISRVRVFQ